MSTSLKTKLTKILLILFLLSISLIWFLSEKNISFAEPQEALRNSEYGLLLIPAYKMNDESLFFFIKNNNLGASFVHKSLFGWKAGMITSSQKGEVIPNRINGVSGHGGNLIYGLISEANYVEVNGVRADHLYVDIMLEPEVVKDYDLENTTLWYFISDVPQEEVVIELYDKDTDELLDSR